jgi:2-isopropylmalate synthase
MTDSEGNFVFDWNTGGGTVKPSLKPIEFDDETLRDGLQSPSVLSPNIEKQIEILHLMNDLGIHSADLGLPGAGPHVQEQVYHLAKEIVDHKLNIFPNCAARTLKVDIQPVIDVSQRVGIPIEVATFIGSSPIRQYAEDWPFDTLLKHTEDAVTFVVENGLPSMYVTEDTTRATPEAVRKLNTTAIECGARRICLCDTVGHATPEGVRNLVKFAKQVVADTGEEVKIDWHGHRDRGLAVPNTIAAIEAGVDRVHACGLGIGERCGNTPMDILLVNLKLMGVIDNDLSKLREYCKTVAEATGVPVPIGYPVIGADAFRTGTGVHAAAVIKAMKKGHNWLADRVYSGVPAGMFGLEQRIEVGPMSGLSNVYYWLSSRGYPVKEELAQEIFQAAKDSKRLLEDYEMVRIVRRHLDSWSADVD